MNKILKEYCELVSFLSKVFNDNVEIILHDTSHMDSSIIAIGNGHVSGRQIGHPMNETGLMLVKNKIYEKQNTFIRYKGVSKKKSKLLCSTKFIKDEHDNLIGMLCINYDYDMHQKYLAGLAEALGISLLTTAHEEDQHIIANVEKFPDNMQEVIFSVFDKAINKLGVPIERLSLNEKIFIVTQLEENGVFLYKGAVNEVAKKLKVSEATLYRYLSKINKKNQGVNHGQN